MSLLNIVFFLNYLVDYKISLRILSFHMKIVFVFVYGKNRKFCFRFKGLKDLGVTVRHFVFHYEDR